jgi:hypothetical protein
MAKKKKHNKKKSQYKASKRSEGVTAAVQRQDMTASSSSLAQPAQGGSEAKNKPDHKRSVPTPDSGDQVVARRARREVKHALVLAGAIMLGLIALWCLFAFTSVGSEVYKFIRI